MSDFVCFVLTWVGDCKRYFWDLLHRSPHLFNPRVEMSTRCLICRSVDRWNDRFCLSLNSGRTVQYKHNAQFLRLFGLHDDVNDAHRAGANRLQNKTKQTKCCTCRTWTCSVLSTDSGNAETSPCDSSCPAGRAVSARP